VKIRVLALTAVLLVLGFGRATAQLLEPTPVSVTMDREVSDSIVHVWRDWRRRGPTNAGLCMAGTVKSRAGGVKVHIGSVTRAARLESCDQSGAIGGAILVVEDLLSEDESHELACAALSGKDQWLVFGLIYGVRRKLHLSGQVLSEPRVSWCVATSAARARLPDSTTNRAAKT
jgi:hypothetical protein